MKYYTASKSRSQGRKFYSIIFRHPVVKDSKGKSGLRVRRGLNTENPKVAEKLVFQMNDILKNEYFWDKEAKLEAEELFDPIIIAAFYEPFDRSREIQFIIAYESELGKGWSILYAINAKDALKKFEEINPDIYKFCQIPYGKLYIGKMEEIEV